MTEPTAKMGGNMRTNVVRVRVTPIEKKRFLEKANEAGLTMSDWIRTRAIGSKPLLRKPSPDRELLLSFLAAFGKAASNLNQVARQLNRKQDNQEFEVPVQTISFVLEELKQATTQLRETLSNACH